MDSAVDVQEHMTVEKEVYVIELFAETTPWVLLCLYLNVHYRVR